MTTLRAQIGIRELRDTLTATLRRVRAGEAIEVTYDGTPVALLMPLPSGRLARLVAGGDVSPGTPLTRPLQRFAVTGPFSASEAILDDRAER